MCVRVRAGYVSMPKYMIRYRVNPSKQPDDPAASYEATKVAMAAADGLAEAGVFKHHWTMGPGDGLIIAKFSSFEEAYRVCNRFWPMLTVEIRELLSWEKTKEITLAHLKEAAGQ